MKKLQALHAFIEQLNTVQETKISAWTENLVFSISGKKRGNGIQAIRIEYLAMINIENWPYTEQPVEIFLSQVAFWLAENDDSRDDLDDNLTRVLPTIHDDGKADLELSLRFLEFVECVEDVDGPLEGFGNRWALADVQVDVADSAEVFGSAEQT